MRRLKRFVALLILASSLLAGCASPDGASVPDALGDLPAAAGDAMSADAAESLVTAALASFPDRYGFRLTATRDGSELLSGEGSFDNATRESYLSLAGGAAFAPLRIPDGRIALHFSERGAIYRFGDLAAVQPALADELEGIVPTELIDPKTLLLEAGAALEVTGVRVVDWNGEPAVRIAFRVPGADENVEGAAIATREPARLVRIEADMPRGQGGPAFGGATLAADILYDEDVPAAPDDLVRLLGVGASVRPTGGDGGQTWTFQRSDGLALADLSVAILDASRLTEGIEAAVAFTVPLADGAGSADAIDVAFADVDGDDTLSEGDTLTITVGDEPRYRPVVVLHDASTGAYVTSDLLVVFQRFFGSMGAAMGGSAGSMG